MPSHEFISVREFSRRVQVSDTAIHKAIKAGRIVDGYDKSRGRKAIEYEVALREWGQNTDTTKPKSTKPKRVSTRRPEGAESSQGDTDSATLQIDFDSSDPALLNESRAKKMKFEAEIKALEYKQKTGELVNRKEVYMELFSFGKELRTAILATPDRVIDDVMASGSRAEAHAKLLKELNTVLESLAGMEGRIDERI